MDDAKVKQDYINDTMQITPGGISQSAAPLEPTLATKAHVSIMAVLVIFLSVIIVNVLLAFLFLSFGSLRFVWIVLMGLVAAITYPSLEKSGYTVLFGVYIFIFSFLFVIGALIAIFVGGFLGMIAVVLLLYYILSTKGLV